MPVLAPNTPFSSKTPQISVDNKLSGGTYLFRLTVVDDSGNQSAPADLRVMVVQLGVVNPGTVFNPGTVVNPGTLFNPGTVFNPGTLVNPGTLQLSETTIAGPLHGTTVETPTIAGGLNQITGQPNS